MPDKAPILALKFTILSGLNIPGERLFLFREGTPTDRSLVPIVFDPAKLAGEVRRGWTAPERRFDRFGNKIDVLIANKRPYTPELLAMVKGFARFKKRELTAFIHRCEPTGQATFANEPVWKFTATGRTTQLHELPGAPAGEMELETGSNVELEV